jgi:hypothetical protein
MPGMSRLAKMARISGKIALGLTAFLLLIVFALFFVNSIDVPLSDRAKALLIAPPNPYPPDQNIYLAIAGIEGPEDRPVVEMGAQRIAEFDKVLDTALRNPEAAINLNKKWNDAKLKVAGSVEDLGHPRTSSIWATVKTHRQEIVALLAANQRLYERYGYLHRLKGYYETARPSFMAPVINPPPSLRTLFLADVANRIQTGTSQQQREALKDLQQDFRLWRTVLKGDGTLISKMLSVAYLHGDMILLADLVTDPNFNSNPLDDVLDSTLLPFDLKDYQIGSAIAAEFRARATLYGTITAGNELAATAISSSWPNRAWNAFQAHFFKPNATENLDAELATHCIALMDLPPNEFQQNLKAYHDWIETNGPHLSPTYIYNPMGKILASLSVSTYEGYPLRAYDVAAYQRLVYLVFQLKRQHIATADVAAFMQAHPDWSTHPVEGKPFSWNPETGELAVSTLGEYPKEQRFSISRR